MSDRRCFKSSLPARSLPASWREVARQRRRQMAFHVQRRSGPSEPWVNTSGRWPSSSPTMSPKWGRRFVARAMLSRLVLVEILSIKATGTVLGCPAGGVKLALRCPDGFQPMSLGSNQSRWDETATPADRGRYGGSPTSVRTRRSCGWLKKVSTHRWIWWMVLRACMTRLRAGS